MNDRQDADDPADEQGPKRRRARIYAERRTVSLRLEPELHQRMMNLCDDLQTPANTYISGLIESDLKKRKK
jgi:predicted HicB family RNase H-like nuclease